MKVKDVIDMYPNFRIEETGGGCQAYCHPLDNGGWIWVTSVNDPSLPEANDKFVSVGRYDKPTARSTDDCVEYVEECAVEHLEKTIDRMLKKGRGMK